MNTQRLAWSLVVLLVGTSGGELAAAPAPGKTPSDKVRALQKERLKALEEVYDSMLERVKIGKDTMASMLGLLQELTEARLDLADTEEDAVKALTKSLEIHRAVEDEVTKLQEAGLQTKYSVNLVRAARLKVEIQLEKRKGR